MIINLRTRNKTQILLAEAQSNQNQKIRIKKIESSAQNMPWSMARQSKPFLFDDTRTHIRELITQVALP